MSQFGSREEHLAEKRQAEIRKLRSLEIEAIHRSRKLGPRDRLKAAFHLTRAWGKAKSAGLRKEDFQDEIHGRLKRTHGSRQEFRLSNWILRRGEDPTTQPNLLKVYEHKTTPQKSLEPYLVGIAVAAEHCGAVADDWKLAMASELSIWPRTSERTDVTLQDEQPSETLAVLLNSLCTRLAEKNALQNTIQAIHRMNCRWEMFSERLHATDALCMQRIESPISPICEDTIYFEEMFPFPSVPLLQVPYAIGAAVFAMAPENGLRAIDNLRLSSGEFFPVGLSFKLDPPGSLGRHYNIPEDAPGLLHVPGDFIWYREIRLCIVPDGGGRFVSALETRPRMEVQFARETRFEGRYHVIHGYEIDLERGLFYGRGDDGGHLFPVIRNRDGQEWRIKMSILEEFGPQITKWVPRSNDSKGWFFEADPVNNPGQLSYEPWYLSYTPATAPYLRHWLTRQWDLETQPAVCPWARDNFEWGVPEPKWDRNLPPIHELNFPDFSNATWVECCLHNGMIEEALQESIDRLNNQTARLQADWHEARERHTNALLRRWKSKTEEEDRQ